KELSQAGICLVSGLARGVDTIVHQVSLNFKGETIAILGSGLDVIYPPENKKLFEEIVEQAGAGISEFPLGSKPKRENFPRRNRLVSGLSSGVLIIEAGEKSGTLITAKWAQEQGKEVFVIPGNIFSEQSKGTHFLLKEGAIPVTQPNEILEYLGISVASCQERRESEDLTPEEEKVLEVLSLYPLQLEEIVAKTGLPLDTLLPLLTELEIKNFIRCLSGKFYQLNPSCLPHLKQ
ncbi:MAG: DNA-processing protein DprA, partial [Caldimicrobium sp.]